jgi:hypothetical protein
LESTPLRTITIRQHGVIGSEVRGTRLLVEALRLGEVPSRGRLPLDKPTDATNDIGERIAELRERGHL